MSPFHRLARRADALATTTAFTAALLTVSARANLAPEEALHPIDPNAVRHGRPDAVRRAQVRRTAVYCAATLFERPSRQLARALGTSRQLVERFIADTEEAREDARLDRELDEIELDLMGAA